jgi:hypothetical protein
MASSDTSIGCEWSRVRFPESPSPEILQIPFSPVSLSTPAPSGLRPRFRGDEAPPEPLPAALGASCDQPQLPSGRRPASSTGQLSEKHGGAAAPPNPPGTAQASIQLHTTFVYLSLAREVGEVEHLRRIFDMDEIEKPRTLSLTFTNFRLTCNKHRESAMCTSEVNARLTRGLRLHMTGIT